MWYFVLILLVNSASFTVTEGNSPNIGIYLKKNVSNITICERVIPPIKLMMGKPFTVTMESEDMVFGGSCSSDLKPSKTIWQFTEKNGLYKIKKHTELKSEIKYALNCTFRVSLCVTAHPGCHYVNGMNYSDVSCYVPLDIRKPNMGFMTVNERKVNTSLASEDEFFDAFGYYHFTDGQQGRFSCQKTITNVALVKLIFNKNGNDSIETDQELLQKNIEMYIKLTKDYTNVGYVDCVIINFRGTPRFITRTFLKHEYAPIDLGFQVNSFPLTPVTYNPDSRTQNVVYQYFDGEVLNVKSLKNSNKYESLMECTQKNIPTEVLLPSLTTSEIGFSYNSEENYPLMSVVCGVTSKRNYGRPLNYTISLQLIPNSFNYNPAIKGLSMANVLLKINGTQLNTIHYVYADNENLSLRCFSDTSKPAWVYNTSDVEAEIDNETIYHTDTNKYQISGKFKLNVHKRNAAVSCVSFKNSFQELSKTTKVVLFGKQYVGSPSNFDGHSETDAAEARHSRTEINKANDTDNEGNEFLFSIKNMKIPLIGGLILLLLIVIAALICIRLTKKGKQPIQNPASSEINYENLPEHNEGPMKLPSQWNEEPYSGPCDTLNTMQSEYAEPHVPTSDIYAKPIPKHLRQGLTQLEPSDEHNAYAEVGNVEPAYAQILPKSAQRGLNYVQVLPKTVNESVHSEILHKKPGSVTTTDENLYAEVRTEDPYVSTYSQIRNENSNAPRSDALSNKYANLFDNDRYVNSNTNDDCAEPAYCEINVKNQK